MAAAIKEAKNVTSNPSIKSFVSRRIVLGNIFHIQLCGYARILSVAIKTEVVKAHINRVLNLELICNSQC